MPKIRFSGAAVVFDSNDQVVKDVGRLKSLDGLKCDDEDSIFSEYIGDGGYDSLMKTGISGGLLWFEFDDAENSLIGHTEYELVRLLSAEEQSLLKDYTIGQWSDGIGSSFSQERMDSGLAPQLLFLDESAVIVKQFS